MDGTIERVPPEITESPVFRSRDGVYEWVYEADDPRIDGTTTMTRAPASCSAARMAGRCRHRT